MVQSIFELIRDYFKTGFIASGDQEKTRYPVDFPLEINVFNVSAMCLMSLLATVIFSISCIVTIRRRGEILSIHGILLLIITGVSLVLFVAAARTSVDYFRFQDEDDVFNLLLDLFLATNLLAGLILLRINFNVE